MTPEARFQALVPRSTIERAGRIRTTRQKKESPRRQYRFRGGNREGYNSRAEELLLYGPAGSGKTQMNLAFIYDACDRFPGARVLIVRKTRASLSDSVLVTWERDILGPNHSILQASNIKRGGRSLYPFQNGSEVILGGMDKPDKVLSSDYDVIYVPEATDLNLTDWETLSGRLRTGVLPFQQIRADCNPGSPSHWLYKRWQAGLLTMVKTTHKDNPRFWDEERQKWTESGEQYVLKRLHRMTGGRRIRFLLGEWKKAEGAVYEEWDPAMHVVDRFPVPTSWKWHMSIDFGFTNPFVCQLWCEDLDGRFYLFKEIYKTQRIITDHAKHVRENWMGQWFSHLSSVIGDHDAGDRAIWERETGIHINLADKRTGPKEIASGVQQVSERLVPAGDGKPRLFVMRDALDHAPDSALIEEGKPTCTEQEFDGWIWDPDAKKGERPLKQDDHGMDACRYLFKYHDTKRVTVDDFAEDHVPMSRAGIAAAFQ